MLRGEITNSLPLEVYTSVPGGRTVSYAYENHRFVAASGNRGMQLQSHFRQNGLERRGPRAVDVELSVLVVNPLKYKTSTPASDKKSCHNVLFRVGASSFA
jgi:hypothetical protein